MELARHCGLAHYIMICWMSLVPCLMLLRMHQPHLHHPWRLVFVKNSSFIHP